MVQRDLHASIGSNDTIQAVQGARRSGLPSEARPADGIIAVKSLEMVRYLIHFYKFHEYGTSTGVTFIKPPKGSSPGSNMLVTNKTIPQLSHLGHRGGLMKTTTDNTTRTTKSEPA